MSQFYRCRLPHWAPTDKHLFLTWRLHGSLPPHRYLPPEGPTSGQAFVCIDRLLDRAVQGPRWLQQPRTAHTIIEALRYGDQVLGHYRLHAWVIMPNHVHLLVSPHVPLPKIMHSLKGFTGKGSESRARSNRTAVLAKGVLRPLDSK
jgi:putative transposase